MIIEPLSWRILSRELPVTLFMMVGMIMAFLAYNFGFIPAVISVPDRLDYTTWGAHFFHISPMHLISNLLIALLTGALLERDVGSLKYALITLLILNFLVVMLFYANPNLLLGFSGVGMGLMSFALCYEWNNQYNRQLLLILIGLNIIFGFFPGISWHGHFFGAVAGVMAFGCFKSTRLVD